MAGLVRWRKDVNSVLVHPETGVPTAPVPDELRRADDPLVVKFRWAFVSDEEQLAETEQARLAVVGRLGVAEPVETATKRPGEKRAAKRAAKPAAATDTTSEVE